MQRCELDTLLRRILGGVGAAVLAVLGIMLLFVLVQGLSPFWGSSRIAIGDFLFGVQWRPEHLRLYGVVPLLAATVLTAVGALLPAAVLAVPGGLFVSEWLPLAWRTRIRGFAEMAANIPSVVYGLTTLFVFVPLLEQLGMPEGRSLTAAILVLACMVLPGLFAASIGAFRSVPEGQRAAAAALAARPMQTAWWVVFPAARRRVAAGMLRSVVRAGGEAAAVVMVAGNSPVLPSAAADSVRTLSATILLEMGHADGVHGQLMFSLGLLLFAAVVLLQLTALRLDGREGTIGRTS